jgi:hypothetical protein
MKWQHRIDADGDRWDLHERVIRVNSAGEFIISYAPEETDRRFKTLQEAKEFCDERINAALAAKTAPPASAPALEWKDKGGGYWATPDLVGVIQTNSQGKFVARYGSMSGTFSEFAVACDECDRWARLLRRINIDKPKAGEVWGEPAYPSLWRLVAINDRPNYVRWLSFCTDSFAEDPFGTWQDWVQKTNAVRITKLCQEQPAAVPAKAESGK